MIPVPAHPILPHPGSGPHPHRSPLRLGRGLRPRHSDHTPSSSSDSITHKTNGRRFQSPSASITLSIYSNPVLKPVHPEALQTILVEDQPPPEKPWDSPSQGLSAPVWDSGSQVHPKLRIDSLQKTSQTPSRGIQFGIHNPKVIPSCPNRVWLGRWGSI